MVAELVGEGITGTTEIQRHVEQFTKKTIFNGRANTLMLNRRFNPSKRDLSNLIYRTRMANLHSHCDDEELQHKVKAWQETCPEDSIFYRPQQKDGLLLVHQTKWQHKLLAKYGSEIALLDATYKTTRYAIPLFFLTVKTNVSYAVVATFLVENEKTVSLIEALNLIKEWTPNWTPHNFMVDFSEAEISALETVFPGKT